MTTQRGRGGFLARLFGKAAAEPIAPAAADPPPTADRPAFQPANPLESLLMAAGTNPAARPAFQQALLDATLLVGTPEAPERPAARTLEQDERLSILTVPIDDGAAAAVFTSEQRLAACFGPGTGYVALEGRALFEIIASGDAILNPGSDYGVHWSSDDIQAMLGRPVRRVVEQDTKVLLGSPAEPPNLLITALTHALADDPRVEAAWLALAHWPDAGESSWYLDIHASAGADDVLPGLADALVPANLAGRSIDVIVNPPSAADGAGIRLKPTTLH